MSDFSNSVLGIFWELSFRECFESVHILFCDAATSVVNSTSMGNGAAVTGANLNSNSAAAAAAAAAAGGGDNAYTQWKMRKREEKRLNERRAYLESQLRRF